MARTLFILFAVMVLAPTGFAMLFGGASLGIGAFMLGSALSGASKPDLPPKKAEWNVVNIDSGSGNTRGYTKLIKRDELVQDRSVRVLAYLNFDEVRGNDPTPVHPEDRENFIKTSAPRLARAECEVLLSVLASKCVVGSTSVNRVGGRELYSIEFGLLYVEKAAMGDVEKQQELSFIESNIGLNRNGGPRTRVGRTGQASLRREFYQEAATVCARQRQQNGNCSVQSVRVSASYDERNHMVNVVGSATLALLQSQTTAQRLVGQTR